VETLQPIRRLTRDVTQFPGHVAFSQDSRMMALEMAPAVIHLKEVATGRTVAQLEDPHGDRAGWIGFTPDGSQLVVVAKYASATHIWDLRPIRQRLRGMGLDWDWPEFPPADKADQAAAKTTREVQIIGSDIPRSESLNRELAALSGDVEREPDSSKALAARAKWLMAHARFDQAERDYERILQLDAVDHWNWFYRACLLAYLGRESEYRDHCRAMLQRFANSQDPSILHRTTRSALLLPPLANASSDALQDSVEALARRAELANQLDPGRTWHVLVKGMAEHRAGRPKAAAEWLLKYQQIGRGRQAAGSVVADAFLALGHHQLGQTQEARTALERAARRAASDMPAAESGYVVIPGGSAEDWLMAQTALREAEETILGRRRTAPSPAAASPPAAPVPSKALDKDPKDDPAHNPD
jgi:tetratricopeptide (TPR) repeat protein